MDKSTSDKEENANKKSGLCCLNNQSFIIMTKDQNTKTGTLSYSLISLKSIV